VNLKELHEELERRQQTYGPIEESWDEIGDLIERLVSSHDSAADRAVLTQMVMKLVRRKHSPQVGDHYDDLQGYTEILKRLKQR